MTAPVPVHPEPPRGFRGVAVSTHDGVISAVVGGSGPAVVLLHGWPQTWWVWRHVMLGLAESHTVLVPNLRGVGGSTITAGGYDKKTMGDDIATLVRTLGHERAAVVGHDIGGQVAYACAAQHPELVSHLVIMSAHVPDATCLDYRLFGAQPWKWWWAFHMVEDVADRLIGDNLAFYIDHRIDRHDPGTNYDTSSIGAFDRGVYVRAYAAPGALTATLEWYRQFPTDVVDNEQFFASGPLTIPYLALADSATHAEMSRQASRIAVRPRVLRVQPSGHWIPEQQPAAVLTHFREFVSTSIPAG
jgi:haloacetate dehalogenase